MRFYIFVYERNTAKSYKAFHEAFVAHPKFYRWSHYLTNSYIIGTDLSAKALSTYSTETLKAHGLGTKHLVLRVDLHERQGRLKADAWDWFQRNQELDNE